MSESNNHRDDIFSKKVRAGQRTYFFDVKATRSNDYYLTITESKRRNGDDGSPFYEKHKIFLHREDFDKFLEAYNESISRINELSEGVPLKYDLNNSTPDAEEPIQQEEKKNDAPAGSTFTDVSFDDLK